jgi:orotate phosphoribosyltransferase-like protein
MANQHTHKEYDSNEINKIINLYESGISLSKNSELLNRKKNNIKKILIDNNVWVEGRDNLKKNLNEELIIGLYNNGLSLQKIADKLNVSKTPVRRVIKNAGIMRDNNGDGKKIELSLKDKDTIKRLYLEEFKNSCQISEELNLSKSFVDKYLHNSGYRRSRSKSISLSKTGVKASENAKHNMKIAQRKLAKSGNRKQTGGVCKTYIIGDIRCQGTYEKWYIEKLIKENKKIPSNAKSVNTPYGTYYPDFELDGEYLEIKSKYTYKILVGDVVNRWTNEINLTQYNKIKWINENITKVNVLVIDKRNNEVIKKHIK